MTTFVFIDTNILLDFYRVRAAKQDLAMLSHIEAGHTSIITSSQVAMEFTRNRPAVILETYKELKDAGSRALPAFLAESRQSMALTSSRQRIARLLTTLRARTKRVLIDPARHDRVYQVAQRLFRDDTALNLSRTKDARFSVRRLAAKRFLLGFPPRKDGDTSIGDAINWEWLVRCASEANADVVIVSRDSDFGAIFEDQPILNDWLKQEFRERVGRRRSVTLTQRLTQAFKAAGIRVSRTEEKAEDEFLRTRHSALNLGFPSAQYQSAFEAINRALTEPPLTVNEALQRLQLKGLFGKLEPPSATPKAASEEESDA